MSNPSLRRRDRRPRLDDEYFGLPDPYAAPPDMDSHRRPRVVQDDPPPSRSSKSDRNRDRPRRYPSPDLARNDPIDPHHGARSGRGSQHSRSVDPYSMGESRRRGRSPPVYVPEPPRHNARAASNTRDIPIRESHRSERSSRDPRHHPAAGAGGDWEPRPPRATTFDSRPPPTRSRRPVSPDSRPRTRGGYDDYAQRPREDNHGPPRRHRSQNPSSRGPDRDYSPPTRSRTHYGGPGAAVAAGAGAGAGAASASRGPRASGGARAPRRNSMPATTQGRLPWWQNPLIQAGGKAAVTAGAQAAMKSRGDQGAWLGAKGAKVATAALGAALVDSFIGQKHPSKAGIAHQGLDFATSAVGDYGPRAEQRWRARR